MQIYADGPWKWTLETDYSWFFNVWTSALVCGAAERRGFKRFVRGLMVYSCSSHMALGTNGDRGHGFPHGSLPVQDKSPEMSLY